MTYPALLTSLCVLMSSTIYLSENPIQATAPSMMTVTKMIGSTPVRDTTELVYVGVVTVSTTSLTGLIRLTPTTIPIMIPIKAAMLMYRNLLLIWTVQQRTWLLWGVTLS